MSRNGMRTAGALVLATGVLLAAGCSEPTTYTSATGNTAANAEVCKGVAQKVMDASLIAHLDPQAGVEGLERDIATRYAKLHQELQPLLQQARTPDLKAAVQGIDTAASQYASQPSTYTETAAKAMTDALGDLQKACGAP
jgi:hypothetical protein